MLGILPKEGLCQAAGEMCHTQCKKGFTLISNDAKLLALATFLIMFCGIVNMWLMCNTFLFNTGKCRDIAFCCLKSKLPADWKMDDLFLWK